MFSVASSSAAIEDTLSQCSRPRQPQPQSHPQQTRGSGGTIQNYFYAHSTGSGYTGSRFLTRTNVDEEEEFSAGPESSPEADPSEASECSDGAESYEKPKQKKRHGRDSKMNNNKYVSSEGVQESQDWLETLSPEKKNQRATRSSNSSSRGVSVGGSGGSRAPGTRQIRADAALSTAKMPVSPSREYEESLQSTTSQAALFLTLSNASAKPKDKTIVEIDQEENGIGMNAKTIVTDSCFGPSSIKENDGGFEMNETNEFRGPNHTKPRCLDRETSLKAVLSRGNSEQIDFQRQRLGKEDTAAAAGASNNDREEQCSDENEETEETDENEFMARNMVLSSDHRSECSDAPVSFSSKRPPSSSSSSSPSSHSASINKETVASARAHPGLSSPSPAKMLVDIVKKVVSETQSGPFSSASKARDSEAARGGRLVAQEECHADTLVDDAVEGSANTDEMYFHDENPPVVRGASAAGSVDFFDAYKHADETTDVGADADGADGGGTDSNADAGLGSTRQGWDYSGGSASSSRSSSSPRSSNPSGRRVRSADGDAVDSPGPRRSSRVEGSSSSSSSSSSSYRSGRKNGGAHGGGRDRMGEDEEVAGGQADAASDGIADMRRRRREDDGDSDGDSDGDGDGQAERDQGTGRAKRKSAEMDARTARSSGDASRSRDRKTTHQHYQHQEKEVQDEMLEMEMEMEMETEGRGVRGGRTRGTAGACNSNINNNNSSSSSIYERNDLSVYTTPDDPPPPSAQRPVNSAAGVGSSDSSGSSAGGATEFLSNVSATFNSGILKLLGTGTAVGGKNGGVIADAGDENSNSSGGVAAAAVSARGTRGGAVAVAVAVAMAGAAPSLESKRRKVGTASTVLVDLTD
jgi:hypothetical protein